MDEQENQRLAELFPEEEMEVREYIRSEINTPIIKGIVSDKSKKIDLSFVISIISVAFIILLFTLGYLYRSELIQKNKEVVMENSIIKDRVGSVEQRMDESEENICSIKKEMKINNEQVNEQLIETNKKLKEANDNIGYMQNTLKTINDSIKDMYNNLSKKIDDSFNKDSSIKGKTFEMKATVYDLSIESCGKPKGHPEYGITFSGVKATKNRTVAVDPKVIPLGSKLYIEFPEKYAHMNGNYVAEDTGSAIKGNKVDIFLGEYVPREQMMQFGIRDVKVTIL